MENTAAKKSLADLKPGESGVVAGLNAEGRIRRRLYDMGVTPGAKVTMHKAAPLGDPLQVTLRGYELTIRKTEASLITVNAEVNA